MVGLMGRGARFLFSGPRQGEDLVMLIVNWHTSTLSTPPWSSFSPLSIGPAGPPSASSSGDAHRQLAHLRSLPSL